MEIDVNLRLPTTANGLELKTISAGSYSNNNGHNNNPQHHQNNNNNNNNNGSSHHRHHHNEQIRLFNTSSSSSSSAATAAPPSGCCGILSRLLCSSNTRGKTGSSSSDYNTYNNGGTATMALYGNVSSSTAASNGCTPATNPLAMCSHHNPSSYMNLLKKSHTHRRTPQEVYFESRGKSCKKLLKFNGNSNKILLYPEEGWARTASSSYWTITPCWWQPNRCRIEEFAGTQRQVTKAKMVPLEQKGSLLVVGHFRSKNSSTSSFSSSQTTTTTTTTSCSPLATAKDNDEFKLYLSSNISMEDYNMGYCLTGFVERRCQQTNTFQMTHFAVIKRQWPSLAQNNKNSKTNLSSFSCGGGGNGPAAGGAGGGGNAASKST